MTIDQIRYFLETAKLQHLGKAAQSLHISPSAVSSAIAALEDEYQCELFAREGKRIRLTEKGQYLRLHAEKLLDQVGAIQLGLRGRDTEFSGIFKIAASHYLACHFLGKLWPKIQQKYSNLTIELGSMPTHQVMRDVISGELDAGLCFSPLRHPDVKGIEIYHGQMNMVARKGHPIFKLPVKDQLKNISQYPALIHKPVVGVDICDDHPMFEKFHITPRIRCFWDSDDVALEILKSSDSWSMLPDIVIQNNQKNLQALPCPPGWSAPVSIMLVLRAHRAESPLATLLASELKSLFT